MPKFKLELLAPHHNVRAFKSKKHPLNLYLHKTAALSSDWGVGLTRVAINLEHNRIAGYYTVLAGAIALDYVPSQERDAMPSRMPKMMPTAHLGRMAVNIADEGEHLGDALVFDALRRAEIASREIAIHAVEVWCLEEELKGYYKRFGFQELTNDPDDPLHLHLYMPMSQVRAHPAIQSAREQAQASP